MVKVRRDLVRVMRGILDFPNTVIESVDLVEDDRESGGNLKRILVHVRPAKKVRYACGTCGTVGTKEGKGVDHRQWRDNDLCGIPLFLEGDTVRTRCPLCGVRVADVPWAYPGSHFTKNFEREVAWMAKSLPRSAVASIKGIDWHTTGRCMGRVQGEMEPDLNGLKHISADEISYGDGSRYLTAVVNLDLNRTVWMGEGRGQSVFPRFCQLLTPEQRESVVMIAGNVGMTEGTREYFPNAVHCDDPFHLRG